MFRSLVPVKVKSSLHACVVVVRLIAPPLVLSSVLAEPGAIATGPLPRPAAAFPRMIEPPVKSVPPVYVAATFTVSVPVFDLDNEPTPLMLLPPVLLSEYGTALLLSKVIVPGVTLVPRSMAVFVPLSSKRMPSPSM